ncbi:transglutaminase-like protein [Leptospira yanagawae serovar Saopaulo str. Sao Paulo = ATCC 700523]|uniref:Transglutaminase-like protein n=1 Tax=Leptospira yanagawae serovar Saopaulo str. Sao Paulo = ATCC 700523 TaxID=1249483 RepID=A0A5E8HFD6_9LEPT|nr:transglutaminase family protein [Leptospira yanagawae]EOQ89398.1 transglutaminase-like protein [Leptospira yanagawae serovar Saopaulo str. Sao Paulo = ATCC 700523]
MADFRVIHKTKYSYDDVVAYCHNMAHMYPLTTNHQDCYRTHVTVNPKPVVSSFRRDYFGNQVFLFSVEDPHRFLEVVVESTVRTHQSFDFDLSKSTPWQNIENLIHESSLDADLQAIEYIQPSPFIPAKQTYFDFAKAIFTDNKPVLLGAQELTKYIYENFEYDPKATNINTPLEQVLYERKGVCQDFSHLMIAALRSLKIPSRYVSGYLETFPPPGTQKLQGSDATHAWVSVYCPTLGWFDFDPTNGKLITEEYIITAIGRDYSDVSPLKGILFGGGKHKLKVEVDVIREQI